MKSCSTRISSWRKTAARKRPRGYTYEAKPNPAAESAIVSKTGPATVSCPSPFGWPERRPPTRNGCSRLRNRPSIEISLRVSWISPAGLTSAAVASSASPTNALPRARLRALGLRKSNWIGTWSEDCAAAGSARHPAAAHASTSRRIIRARLHSARALSSNNGLLAHHGRRRSSGVCGGERDVHVESPDTGGEVAPEHGIHLLACRSGRTAGGTDESPGERIGCG